MDRPQLAQRNRWHMLGLTGVCLASLLLGACSTTNSTSATPSGAATEVSNPTETTVSNTETTETTTDTTPEATMSAATDTTPEATMNATTETGTGAPAAATAGPAVTLVATIPMSGTTPMTGTTTIVTPTAGEAATSSTMAPEATTGTTTPQATTNTTATPSGEGATGGQATTLTTAAEGTKLAFTQASLSAPANTQVTLTFNNNSDVLQHNWVLVNGGKDVAARVNDVAVSATPDYIPDDDPDIIAHTELLNPGESGKVTFTTPGPGEYYFICTFPGHYAAGMYGTLTVGQ